MAQDFAPFGEFEHAADLGLRARGRTMEELFANAARGMTELLGGASSEAIGHKTIELEGLDPEHLLVRWLSEILYLYREGRACAGAEFEALEKTRLRAGCRLSGVSGRAGKEIKMVTHHGVRIEEKDGIFQAEVVLDV